MFCSFRVVEECERQKSFFFSPKTFFYNGSKHDSNLSEGIKYHSKIIYLFLLHRKLIELLNMFLKAQAFCIYHIYHAWLLKKNVLHTQYIWRRISSHVDQSDLGHRSRCQSHDHFLLLDWLKLHSARQGTNKILS